MALKSASEVGSGPPVETGDPFRDQRAACERWLPVVDRKAGA